MSKYSKYPFFELSDLWVLSSPVMQLGKIPGGNVRSVDSC